MLHRFIACFVIAVFSAGILAQDITEPVVSVPPPQNSSVGGVIVVGLIFIAGGVGSYFLYSHKKREKETGDSVIMLVENAWDSASVLYAEEKYREAISQLEKITVVWYEYSNYSAKFRRRNNVDPDSIASVIASCDFLESMIPTVKTLTRYAEGLPGDEFSLEKIDRHDLEKQTSFLKNAIDSIVRVNPNHHSALSYSLRHIKEKIEITESVIKGSYSHRRDDFSVKNKFYYNKAVASNDTIQLRRFVEDCEYYGVDKEWCQRARVALGTGKNEHREDALFPSTKMTVKDSIVFAFDKVMRSSQIEEFERYIKKYSLGNYRRYAGLVRMKEVKGALRILRGKIDAQVALADRYPRFDNRNVAAIELTCKGLPNYVDTLFQNSWNTLHDELSRISARLPASMQVDYTVEPPVLLFDAIIDPATDITMLSINGHTAYRIGCLLPMMKTIHRLKKGVVASLNSVANLNAQTANSESKKIDYSAYSIRLRKPENRGTVLFYARENRKQPIDASEDIEFYDFYDILIPGYTNKRCSIYPTSLPNIIPSLSSDSLEQIMGEAFFTE